MPITTVETLSWTRKARRRGARRAFRMLPTRAKGIRSPSQTQLGQKYSPGVVSAQISSTITPRVEADVARRPTNRPRQGGLGADRSL